MHIGKIGQKSAAFINHKPFHPGSYRNLEKVWIAEQKDAELKRKQQELLEQRLQEGKIEELRHALHTGQAAALSTYRTGTTDLQWVGGDDNDGQLSTVPSHIAREISDNKLDWMYQNASQIRADQDREKFLLGEKTVEDNEEDEKQALKDLNGKAAGSLLLGAKSALSETELMSRVREDPMFSVKQAELAHQQALQKNPLIRARLRAKAEEEAQRVAEEARAKREAEIAPSNRHHHRHHHHHHRSHNRHRRAHTPDSDRSRRSDSRIRTKRRRSPSRSNSANRIHASSSREDSRSPRRKASNSPGSDARRSSHFSNDSRSEREASQRGRPRSSMRHAAHHLHQPRQFHQDDLSPPRRLREERSRGNNQHEAHESIGSYQSRDLSPSYRRRYSQCRTLGGSRRSSNEPRHSPRRSASPRLGNARYQSRERNMSSRQRSRYESPARKVQEGAPRRRAVAHRQERDTRDASPRRSKRERSASRQQERSVKLARQSERKHSSGGAPSAAPKKGDVDAVIETKSEEDDDNPSEASVEADIFVRDEAASAAGGKDKVCKGPQIEESLLVRLRREGESAILGPPLEMVDSLRKRQEHLRASKASEAAEAERLDLEGMKSEAEKYHDERRERLAEIKRREAVIEEREKEMSLRRLPDEAPKFIHETRKDLLDSIDRVAQLHNMRRRDNLDEGY